MSLLSRHAPSLALVAALAGCTPTQLTRTGVLTLPDGGELHYAVAGHGPDTVLVVGGTPGVPYQLLVSALHGLARDRVVVHYDARGRGQGRLGAGAAWPSLDRDVEDLDALRRHLGAGSVDLVGHYYGAAVAAFYARRHGERVRRVALLGPIQPKASNSHELALWSTRTPEQLAAYFDERRAGRDTLDPAGFCRSHWLRWYEPVWIDDDAVRRHHAPDVCGPALTAAMPQALVRDSLVAALTRGQAWDWIDSLAAVSRPMLVIGGRRDPVRRFLFRWWAHAAPEARILLVEGESTFPWVESGEAVSEALRTFLAGSWPHGSVAIDTPPVPDASADERRRWPMWASLGDDS